MLNQVQFWAIWPRMPGASLCTAFPRPDISKDFSVGCVPCEFGQKKEGPNTYHFILDFVIDDIQTVGDDIGSA